MQFNTILKLGPNRERTREGFTLFRNVSVSRTGVQIYGADELTGIQPGPDGLVYISRTPEEVFRPETLDSGNGKSFVILHPEEDVTPVNWRDLTHGVMFNMRRGSGEQKDDSVCDVMVYTDELLREIDLGMREVSLGYDADYFETGPGRGEQRNIYINHVALVPSGRCGPRCAVTDHRGPPQSENTRLVLDAIRAARARRRCSSHDGVVSSEEESISKMYSPESAQDPGKRQAEPVLDAVRARNAARWQSSSDHQRARGRVQ